LPEGVLGTFDGPTTKRGPIAVLDQIGLHVARGEAVAVLGPTGAGKSTLMKCLRGLIRPVSGNIGFGAAALARHPAHRLARAGLILVPEGRQVFARLTVTENLVLGATRRSDFDESEICSMLDRFPKLRARLHTAAGLLSGGELQMLAVARGLLARTRYCCSTSRRSAWRPPSLPSCLVSSGNCAKRALPC
jgi:branched-chain amino acid transport system ATP-binding protein